MIAASIPVMKPLVDFVVGRHTFSSTNSRNRYEKHSASRSGNLCASDVERSAGGGFRRGKPKDPMSITALDTVVDNENLDEGRKSDGHDSQTNIVPKTADDYYGSRHNAPLPPRGAIVRTDHVAVTTTYGSDTASSGRTMDRWK